MRLRDELFLRILRKVMEAIEGEIVEEGTRCERDGLALVRNGQDMVTLAIEQMFTSYDNAKGNVKDYQR